jgi:DNA-binding response OmpR family regulator
MSQSPLILVVDDDPDIVDALRFMLEDEGFDVQTTDKAAYAESLHDGNGRLPDLIILDVLLSGADGRAICRKLKSQDDTKHIPILMISAHPNAEQSVKDVGADAFVAKPFGVDELLSIMNGLLNRTPASGGV